MMTLHHDMTKWVRMVEDIMGERNIRKPSRVVMQFPSERDAREFLYQMERSLLTEQFTPLRPAPYPFRDAAPQVMLAGTYIDVGVSIR